MPKPACSWSSVTPAEVANYLFFAVTSPIKALGQDVARKSGTGWKLTWSHQAGDGAERHAEENVSLWSPLLPTGITQLDFRLFFFSFHSPPAHLISALARLFSFICFIPLYCHNVADHECSHRSLVQLISEVVLLQIGSLNLVSLHSFSGLHFQGEKAVERMDKHTLGRLAHENVKNFGKEGRENHVWASECTMVFFWNIRMR